MPPHSDQPDLTAPWQGAILAADGPLVPAVQGLAVNHCRFVQGVRVVGLGLVTGCGQLAPAHRVHGGKAG